MMAVQFGNSGDLLSTELGNIGDLRQQVLITLN